MYTLGIYKFATMTTECGLHHKHTKYTDEDKNVLGQMLGRIR